MQKRDKYPHTKRTCARPFACAHKHTADRMWRSEHEKNMWCVVRSRNHFKLEFRDRKIQHTRLNANRKKKSTKIWSTDTIVFLYCFCFRGRIVVAIHVCIRERVFDKHDDDEYFSLGIKIQIQMRRICFVGVWFCIKLCWARIVCLIVICAFRRRREKKKRLICKHKTLSNESIVKVYFHCIWATIYE